MAARARRSSRVQATQEKEKRARKREEQKEREAKKYKKEENKLRSRNLEKTGNAALEAAHDAIQQKIGPMKLRIHRKTVPLSLKQRTCPDKYRCMNKLAKDGAKLLAACSELAHEALLEVFQPGEIRLSTTTNLPVITHEQFLAWEKFDLVQEVSQDPGSFLGSLLTEVSTVAHFGWPRASASALVSDRLWAKYKKRSLPRLRNARRILSGSLSRLAQNFLEMMKPKKFWKAIQKYTRVCLRLVHFAAEEKRAQTGYERKAAKVAFKIMKAAQHGDTETPPRANEIDGQGVFTVREIRRVLNHLKTLLAPLILAGQDIIWEQKGRRKTPAAAFRASYNHGTNVHKLRILTIISCCYDGQREPVRNIYRNEDLSDEEKREARLHLPYATQRMPGSFSIFPLMKIRDAAFVEFTKTSTTSMIKGGHLPRSLTLPEDGFWPHSIVTLRGQDFIWRTREWNATWSGRPAHERPRRPRGVPSMAYSWEEYQARMMSDPLHLPWIMDGFKSNGRELHVTLARWIIADRDVAKLYDMYRPLAGSRAQARTGLGMVNFDEPSELPKGLYNDIEHEGGPCDLRVAAIDVGKRNFVALKRAIFSKTSRHANFTKTRADNWQAFENTALQEMVPSSALLQDMETERMQISEYAQQHAALAKTRGKTAVAKEVEGYIDARQERANRFSTLIFTRKRAALSFRRRQEKQIALSKLASEITADVDVIFIGDGRVNSGVKGHRHVPQRELLLELAKRKCVVVIDEAYTSCRCCACKSETKMKTVYATQENLQQAQENLTAANAAMEAASQAPAPRLRMATRRQEAAQTLLDKTRQRQRRARERLERVTAAKTWLDADMPQRQALPLNDSLLSHTTSDARVEVCQNDECRRMHLHDENSTDNDLELGLSLLNKTARPRYLSCPRGMQGVC